MPPVRYALSLIQAGVRTVLFLKCKKLWARQSQSREEEKGFLRNPTAGKRKRESLAFWGLIASSLISNSILSGERVIEAAESTATRNTGRRHPLFRKYSAAKDRVGRERFHDTKTGSWVAETIGFFHSITFASSWHLILNRSARGLRGLPHSDVR